MNNLAMRRFYKKEDIKINIQVFKKAIENTAELILHINTKLCDSKPLKV